MKWRPIKSAPKDQHIILRYPSFEDHKQDVVNQGRWVDCHHVHVVSDIRRQGKNPDTVPTEGHWEIAYVAVIQHGGAWTGHSFQEKGVRVEPTHWMPLPSIPKRR